MKGAFLTAAAALMGSALADGHMRRHGHEAFHHRRALGTGVSGLVDAQETCGCTTKVITYYGSPTLVPHPAPSSAVPAIPSSAAAVSASPAPSSSPASSPAVSPVTTSKVTQTQSSTSYSTVTVEASSSPAPSPAPTTSAVELPTPSVTTFPNTGTFTIPETTITVKDTTTVCGATSTSVPSGTHTLGGVTTIVETSTVVTCPYATVKPTGSTVTSVIETTTYTCPAAGTYTVVPPFTTTVPSSTVIVYPTPATITPGTYPRPAQVVTVTETDYTYTCPFDTGLPSSTPAVTPSSAPAVATSSPVSGVAAQATSSTPSVTPSSSASPSATPSASSGSSGNRYAMVYGVYTNDNGCKTQNTINQEIADIAKKGFSAVRVYSTDCNTLEYVGQAARANSIKMIPGVYIESGDISSAYSQLKDLISWAQWDLVDAIVLGNEAIQGGAIDASGLASFVKAGKTQLTSAGYTGMVTLAETLNIWQQYSGTLCEVVDQPVVNSYAYFNGAISALGAGSFVKSELDELNGLCPGKSDGWVGESGWPSQGNSLGAAIANTVEQTIAILAIEKEIGHKVAFFEYENEAWKPAGSLGVEKFWGCFNVFSWLL